MRQNLLYGNNAWSRWQPGVQVRLCIPDRFHPPRLPEQAVPVVFM
jgi:hypothetical protein